MPRGRHRSVSTATRISLLAAICAPALVAVVLAVVAGGATTLRIAVLLGVLSAVGAVAWVVRGSTAQQRRLAEESIARRRERERMAEELRLAVERAEEHGLVLDVAAEHLTSRPQQLTPDLFARASAVLDLLDRRGGEARPTAPSIVPAVRRPPVSSPDLVPAYAASVFGPAARPPAAPATAAPVGERAPVRAAIPAPAPEVRTAPEVETAPETAPVEPAVGSAAPAAEIGRPARPIAPPTELTRYPEAARGAERPADSRTAPEAIAAEPASEAAAGAESKAESQGDSRARSKADSRAQTKSRAKGEPAARAAGEAREPAVAPAPAVPVAAPVAAEAPGRAPAEIQAQIRAEIPTETPADEPATGSPAATPEPAAIETAAAPEPAAIETAEVTRMVRDKVREVTRRVAGAGTSGRFDFFAPRAPLAEPEATGFLTDELFGSEARYDALIAGRPHADPVERAETDAPARPLVDDIEADRIADPVRAEAQAPAAQPAPAHRGQGVRFAPTEPGPARSGAGQPKPLPVDLTAHDDTEEIPRIDIRKHA